MQRPTAEDALSEEQLDRLLAQPNRAYPTGKRNLTLLLIMADAGLRVSEATALTTGDLVREGGQLTHVLIRHGKGNKRGKVALTRRTAAKLGGWLQARAALGIGSRAIFCTISKGKAGGYFAQEGQQLEAGKPISTHYVRRLVKRLAQKAGIEKNVSPHTLRHTFATRFLRATGNLELTRKALRHARIQTTAEIYSHLVQEDVDNGIGQLPGSEEYEARSLPEADKMEQIAKALAALTNEQRQGLAKAVLRSG